MSETPSAQAPRKLACAVYTRKSTEEGLDQSFNSLDAQREACEAYIESQFHEGWLCLPERYDDGGYSGGTMDRPALKRLLSDIAAGKVAVVVIYKIDRLSRSLADFARIVEVFDRSGASFVSVTQSFSTATSTGRLTLNMLLSFAQFERELGAERVRDKIAASKRRGMWMGGVCPLGYDVHDRALVVNQEESATVRLIFSLYLELGSVLAVDCELRRRGVVSKCRTSRTGKQSGGKHFSRGALYLLLRNVLYVGRVAHRSQTYPGQHQRILEQHIFDRAQGLLDSNARNRRGRDRSGSEAAVLTGIVFDGYLRPMMPTHTTKGTRRYRYYATKAAAGSDERCVRVPAGELESIVLARIHAFLSDPGAVHDALQTASVSASESASALERANVLCGQMGEHVDCAFTQATKLVDRVIVRAEEIEIAANPIGLLQTEAAAEQNATCTFIVPARLVRRTRELRLVVPPPRSGHRRDAGLIKLLVRGHQARKAFEAANGASVSQVAATRGCDAGYFAVLLKLGYLAPAVAEDIICGRQPPTLTRQRLARIRSIPFEWSEQRKLIAIDETDQLQCHGFRDKMS